ncbi:AMP-binding protein [uncultured Methylobacterium sp.]|uniref:AMP-binding protein n=1 Tax=uncultured Methylobacterium sp. TaxID=157278 RepID=UPI0035CC6E63
MSPAAEGDDPQGAHAAPAIVSGARRRTHEAVRDTAHRAAEGFRRLGIGADDAVALVLRNDFAPFEAAQGASLAGAYAVPINWHMDADGVGAILRDCAARALVVHSDLLPRIAAGLPPGLAVLVVETPEDLRAAYPETAAAPQAAGSADWDEWVARHPPIAAPVTALRPAVIYTSGSTGRPKGVRRAVSTDGTPSARARAVYGLDGEEPATVLITGPLYHSVPNANARVAFQAGATLVLQPRFDPERTLALIAHHRVTALHAVPAMFSRLLRLPDAVRARYDLASLRHVVHGAAPCPPAVKAAMIAWWGPIVHEYYGATETGLLTLSDSAEALARPGTVGRALPGISLHVLDDDGCPLPPGTPGRIYAGSESLHRFTYVGRDAERAAIARDTLVTAGDIGVLDADGYLYLRGRARDVIVSNGATLYPADIEAAALTDPAVQDCAAFGLPDAAGETVCACVEPVPGRTLDPAALAARIRAAVPAAGRLRVEVIANMPREDSGKVFKGVLRGRFGG